MIRPSFGGFGPRTRTAARTAWAKGQDAIEFADLKIGGAPELALLSDASLTFIRRARGSPKLDGGLPMSSRTVRAANGAATIEAVMDACRSNESLRNGHRRLRLLTVKPDIGLVDISSPSFPAGLVRWDVDRRSRGVVADGLFHLDLALICPARGCPETLAAVHTHAAVSFHVEHWKRAEWLVRLAPVSGNENALGDTIVDISSHGNNRKPRLKPASAAGLGWYLSKETAGVNTIYQSKAGQKSEGNHTDWTFVGALRQLEFWSHISAFSVCWSQGAQGNDMRTAWRRKLLELLDFCEMPKTTTVDGGKMHEGWARAWRELDNGFQAIDPDTVAACTAKELRRVDGERAHHHR